MTTNHVILPLFSDPYYSYSISLEGNSYILEFVYNERTEMYFFSLLTSDNAPVVAGEALVPTYPMFLDYILPNLTGFFWMEEKADIISEPYKIYPDKINEYYNFFYIYES